MKLLSFIKNIPIVKRNPSYYQFIKFSVVGTIGMIIDVGILNLLIYFFSVNIYISATISFILAVISNFILNRIWTFNNIKTDKKPFYQFIQFVMVSVIGLGINLLIMYVFIEWAGLWYNWAKIIAIIIVLLWNYFINKIWTFKGTVINNSDLSKT